jgi:hypothetical protein
MVTRACEIDGNLYVKGDVVIIEHTQHAANISSMSEGLLMPLDERAPDKPEHDRMVKATKHKR